VALTSPVLGEYDLSSWHCRVRSCLRPFAREATVGRLYGSPRLVSFPTPEMFWVTLGLP